MIIAALLALAVIASLFLIFSNSVQLLRVGLVVALWAATLGAIAMTKYRRESALDKAKVADLQTVYERHLFDDSVFDDGDFDLRGLGGSLDFRLDRRDRRRILLHRNVFHRS